ncbi:gamma-crystallin M1-1-like isoform X2 [Pleurodeles waltl]|uniref:gamma-crystallin M1-1-like isoform X2 n=1 Tax=Pleurodeles waltl TaxID=8319 RepID=UPI003709446D
MGKITFYELKNFQGKFYECTCDNLDLQSHLNSCNSIRVENGLWMVYERPHYMGNQYFLKEGEYPDYHVWTGISDSIKSCLLLSLKGLDVYRLRVYEKDDCTGKMTKFMNDCTNVHDHFCYPIRSCQVLGGLWLFFEKTDYRGKQYLLKPGKYERFTDWGSAHGTIGSLKRVMETL